MTTPAPAYARHTKKTEWGVGLLVESDGTYFRYLFQDGEARAFPAASLSFLTATQPSSEESAALDTLRGGKKSAAGKAKKPKKKAVLSDAVRGGPDSTRKQVPQISTLEKQLSFFRQSFPKGFEDEKFIDQERGGNGSRKGGKQAIVTLAQELFAAEPLREILLSKKGVGAAGLCKKLVAKSKGLLSTDEIETFYLYAKTPANELRLAEALFDLLHGQGSAGAKLEALTVSFPVELRTWRLCTLVCAFFAPNVHLFIDPEVTFRQAHIVGVPVSFQSTISGAEYEQLVTMGQGLLASLAKENLKPRDLLDVHLFSLRTLHPDVQKKLAKKSA
jgi:hypothetical protein